MSKIHGKGGSISLGSTFLYATSWTIEVDRDFANVSVLGDAAQVWAAGLRGVNGTFEGLYDSGHSNAPLSATYSDAVTVTINAASGVQVATGTAWVTARVTGSVTDAVRVSGSFKGTGAWSVS
jgi:hypothetical protein